MSERPQVHEAELPVLRETTKRKRRDGTNIYDGLLRKRRWEGRCRERQALEGVKRVMEGQDVSRRHHQKLYSHGVAAHCYLAIGHNRHPIKRLYTKLRYSCIFLASTTLFLSTHSIYTICLLEK